MFEPAEPACWNADPFEWPEAVVAEPPPAPRAALSGHELAEVLASVWRLASPRLPSARPAMDDEVRERVVA